MGGCDTQDLGFLLAAILHEMITGQVTAADTRRLRDHGGLIIPTVVYTDAMSVFAAVTAVAIKVPTDSNVLCDLQYLRELLDHGVLDALVWVDTRDMLADGMTKERNSHEMKLWRPNWCSATSITVPLTPISAVGEICPTDE